MTHEGSRRSVFAAFRETLLAFTFDIGGLAAGFFVASQLGVFQLSTWAIAVYPAILGVKGVLQGLLTRRLGAALHLGTVYPRFTKNTDTFYRTISASVVATLLISVMMSIISLGFGAVLWGASLAESGGLVLVVVASMSLGLFLSLVTIKVAFVSFKRGLDPDIIVYPIMSTVADIFITFCFVSVLDLFFIFNPAGTYVVFTIILVHIGLVILLFSRNLTKEFRRALKDSFPTLLFVSFMGNITGTVLQRISTIVRVRREKEVYTAYPALGDTVGDVSSIVGFTTATRLALGLLRPSLSSMVHHMRTVASAWAASIVVFIAIAFFAPAINGVFVLSTFVNLLMVLLFANVIAVFVMVLISYGLAILTFQRSLDPDNFVIPVESALADTLVSVALLVALILVK